MAHSIDQRAQVILGFGQSSSFHLAIIAVSSLIFHLTSFTKDGIQAGDLSVRCDETWKLLTVLDTQVVLHGLDPAGATRFFNLARESAGTSRIGLPPPAGARKGLPYKADAVPLRITRTGLPKTTGSETSGKGTASRGAGLFKFRTWPCTVCRSQRDKIS